MRRIKRRREAELIKCNKLLHLRPYDEVLKNIQYALTPENVVISIAPGISIDYLKKKLGSDKRIVRAMPNTPALLGSGMTGVSYNNDELTLGSVTAQTIDLKLYKTAVPDTINKVYIETGITDEIIPIGYFNVDDISKDDDYTITLKLRDNMIKFEFNYNGSELSYPCSILTILKDICSKAGVELRFYFLFESK